LVRLVFLSSWLIPDWHRHTKQLWQRGVFDYWRNTRRMYASHGEMLAANQTSPTLVLPLEDNSEVRLDFLECETKKTYSVLNQDLRTC
jgi:hypothetical protein